MEAAHARDLVALKASLLVLPRLRELLSSLTAPLLKELQEKIDPCPKSRPSSPGPWWTTPPWRSAREG